MAVGAGAPDAGFADPVYDEWAKEPQTIEALEVFLKDADLHAMIEINTSKFTDVHIEEAIMVSDIGQVRAETSATLNDEMPRDEDNFIVHHVGVLENPVQTMTGLLRSIESTVRGLHFEDDHVATSSSAKNAAHDAAEECSESTCSQPPRPPFCSPQRSPLKPQPGREGTLKPLTRKLYSTTEKDTMPHSSGKESPNHTPYSHGPSGISTCASSIFWT